MRNRAKCKLCNDVIESCYKHDYCVCKCGEIAVDGGQEYRRCVANNKENFIALDDDGNVVEIKEAAKQSDDLQSIHSLPIADLPGIIDSAIKETERVVETDISARVTQFDILSILYLLKEIAKHLKTS